MARGVAYTPTDKDRAMVKALAVQGLPQKRIAAVIGVNQRTLTKYFKEELERAKDEFIGLCVNKLWTLVNKGNAAAIFFALKTQAGWREKGDDDESKAQPTTLILNISRGERRKHDDYSNSGQPAT